VKFARLLRLGLRALAAGRDDEARLTGTTTKPQPGPEFLIQTFKQPIDPSSRKPSNSAPSARRSERSLLAASATLEAHASGPATVRARVLRIDLALGKRRGRRECRVTTSPMARLQQKKQAAVTTGRAGSPAFPARWCYGLYRALPGDLCLVATVIGVMRSIIANLAPASERQDHTTSPSASGHVRLMCHPRPPHPRPTYRDDRPKRPSSSRRDAREHRRDLPDGASANMCDRLARRAICAWHACGNCPSGKCVRGCKPRPSQQRAHASTAGSGQAFFTANDHTFPARLTSAAPTTLKMSVDRGRPETRSGRPSAKVTRSAPTSGPDPTGRRTRTLRTSRQ
jgi:hypothetical protein